MNSEEFAFWTLELVEQGRLTVEQAADARQQRARFDRERPMIEEEFRGLVVGYVAGERLVGSSAPEVLDAAEDRFGRSRQVYFEPVASNPVEADEVEAAMPSFAGRGVEVEARPQVFASMSQSALPVGGLFAAVVVIFALLKIFDFIPGSELGRSPFLWAGGLIVLVALGGRFLLEHWRARRAAKRREAEREKTRSGS